MVEFFFKYEQSKTKLNITFNSKINKIQIGDFVCSYAVHFLYLNEAKLCLQFRDPPYDKCPIIKLSNKLRYEASMQLCEDASKMTV